MEGYGEINYTGRVSTDWGVTHSLPDRAKELQSTVQTRRVIFDTSRKMASVSSSSSTKNTYQSTGGGPYIYPYLWYQ